MAGAQLGTLLGWMGGRVLGQYDLLVRRDDADAATTARCTSSARTWPSLEQRFGFDPTEFRTWVLVHELTHRAQFTGVPWMREPLHRPGRRAARRDRPRPDALLGALRDAWRQPDEARQQVRDSGVAGLIASPEQRAVIGRIGGLMSLLEGHGDVTMNRAAGDLVPHAERFARVLAERRKRGNPLSRLVLRLTGHRGQAQPVRGRRAVHRRRRGRRRPAGRRRLLDVAGEPAVDGRDPRAAALAGPDGARAA